MNRVKIVNNNHTEHAVSGADEVRGASQMELQLCSSKKKL